MNITNSIAASLLAGAAALGLAVSPATASSLDQAQLACFVDTYAFDELTPDFCISVWTPGTGDLNSVAYFEVIGLPAGSYSYSWNFTCGNYSYCITDISARWNPTRTAHVTVQDLATGQQRTLTATAHYFNGWD